MGSGQQTNLLDVLHILGNLADRAVDPLFYASRLGDIRRSYGNIAHAADLLGYRPTVSLADGLQDTFAWYRSHESWLPNETLCIGKK